VRDQRSAEACRQQGRPSSNGEIGRHFCDEDAPEIEPRGDLAMESIIDQPPGSLAAFLDLAGLYAVASTEIVVVSTIFGRPAGPRPLIALLTAKWTARLTASGSPVDYLRFTASKRSPLSGGLVTLRPERLAFSRFNV
jgi:hypothetical protein